MSDNDNNDIADILDEAKIGVDHLVKLYPNEQTFVHRIGDLKADHRKFGILPEEDELDKTNRPALIGFDRDPLAKYAYTMALAYNVLHDIQLFSHESQQYIVLARRAYEKAKITGSGHFDKLCLAAVELYLATKDSKYLDEAKIYNDKLSSNNYGHYPNNTNLAHARLAPYYQSAKDKLQTSVKKFNEASHNNLFGFDVEYSWGSLYIALSSANQGWLYSLLADDDSYSALQTRIRDYTLGVNPWGVCFISGMGTEYPRNIHNSPVVALKKLGKLKEGTIPGAVAEGPISRSDWEKNYGRFVPIDEDKYYKYHTSACVYHDHVNDYVTNEPCSYGAAEAILFFSFYLRYLSNDTRLPISPENVKFNP